MTVRRNVSVLDIRGAIERSYVFDDKHRNEVWKGKCWNRLRGMDKTWEIQRQIVFQLEVDDEDPAVPVAEQRAIRIFVGFISLFCKYC